MAWQYPKHVCGHEGPRYQAYGPLEMRKRRLLAVQSHPCPNCKAKAAAEKAEAGGLPVLKGSPKQVGWASDIREHLLKVWREEIEGAEKMLGEVEERDLEKARQVVEGARTRMADRIKKDEARWWIENQDGQTPLDEEVQDRIALRLKIVKAM